MAADGPPDVSGAVEPAVGHVYFDSQFRCPQCRGLVRVEQTEDGPAWKCFGCGRDQTREVVAQMPRRLLAMNATGANGVTVSVNGHAPAPVAPSKADWVTAARSRLRTVLGEIRAVDQLRDEAERIHAALSVYGVSDLEALPWKNAEPAPRDPRSRAGISQPGSPCSRCGIALFGRQIARDEQGNRICRNDVACIARIGAAAREAR